MSDLISRQAAIDTIADKLDPPHQVDGSEFEKGCAAQWTKDWNVVMRALDKLPSAQPEIIRCKDCEYGEQDDIGRWFCNDLGCQIGSEDGSGYCANAERRTDG